MQLVEHRNGECYVTGSRVTLASIVYRFRDGASAESIRESFPSLNLAQIYGALAYYLHHPVECEQYLAEVERRWREIGKTAIPFFPRTADSAR
jgi:uncharacterized protein (DUF433 family)